MVPRSAAVRAAAAALVLACAAVPADAQTLRLDGYQSGASAYGYAAGLATGTFVTATGTAASVTILCVDVLNAATTGATWAVSVGTLGPTPALAGARQPLAAGSYRRAAWLADRMGRPEHAASIGDIHGAVWRLFAPAFTTGAGESAGAMSDAEREWTMRAAAAEAAGFADAPVGSWVVLTDVAGAGMARGGMQEFIAYLPDATVTVTPEPTTWALLGLGLGGLAIVARRRRAEG